MKLLVPKGAAFLVYHCVFVNYEEKSNALISMIYCIGMIVIYYLCISKVSLVCCVATLCLLLFFNHYIKKFELWLEALCCLKSSFFRFTVAIFGCKFHLCESADCSQFSRLVLIQSIYFLLYLRILIVKNSWFTSLYSMLLRRKKRGSELYNFSLINVWACFETT